MNRYLCIHGHFYQPPRENAWLEEVEYQDSAYPYHDWNERITAEAYAPNTASRILGAERRIINIVNNYSSISFNVGPTLFSWLERHEPAVYEAILEADRVSRRRFSGHGAAMAQVYNHMIVPLASERDRRTQVLWGIADFRRRFRRDPEGMWLPETAVDLATLEILAEQGIASTILAPGQAQRVRRTGSEEWQDVSGGRIDPRVPYLCRLPGGGSMALFFYDGPVARDVSFGEVLSSGEAFAGRLLGGFDERPTPQLVHIATDGETYGHHRPFGDMALAYCLYHVQEQELARTTVYGEFLERYPPAWEVEIFEDSSWSCAHGVERWRSDCGCNSGMHPGWNQAWRAPLRSALDWLRDACLPLYQAEAARYLRDPWAARDAYIDLILDRRPESVSAFFARQASRDLGPEERVQALKLLELQRHAMLMYTSCGWFFDEISGLETTQILQYAARVLQLAEDVLGVTLEARFLDRLREAPSNIPQFGNGAQVYRELVRPGLVDLLRVGVHYAVSSLQQDYAESTSLYCYSVTRGRYERSSAGRLSLSTGHACLHSEITQEEREISFAVLHLGGHIINGGAREFRGQKAFAAMQEEVNAAFLRTEIPEVIRLMDEHFGTHNYSIWHLFRDEQRAFFSRTLDNTLEEMRATYRKIYEDNYAVIQAMTEMRIPVPAALRTPLEFTLNEDLRELLEAPELDGGRLAELVAELERWHVQPEAASAGLRASRRARQLLQALSERPEDDEALEHTVASLELLHSLPVPLNLWEAQNSYFLMARQVLEDETRRAAAGAEEARAWMEHFQRLGDLLEVRVVP